jgi:hypothetical protein
MMARLNDKDRKQVGTIGHDCGAVANVYQSKRRHLYLICPACGACDQRQGAAVQTDLYRNMTPATDAPITEPPNLIRGEPAQTSAAPMVEPVFVPEKIPETVPEIPIGTRVAGTEAGTVEPAQTSAAPEVSGYAEPIGEDAPEKPVTQKTNSTGLFWLLMAGFAGLGIAAAAVINPTKGQTA